MSDAFSAASPAPSLSAPQKALRKLGLVRPIDLALHLPLRYEDETRIVRLSDAHEGTEVQIQGMVCSAEIRHGSRRQLLVLLDDGSDSCVLRFFSFYPSHQKTLTPGAQIRARGELRRDFQGGWTMLHPSFVLAGVELPHALTPVYPTSAGLPQAYLRRAVLGGLARADLSETIPRAALDDCPGVRGGLGGWVAHEVCSLQSALSFLHQPSPDVALAALEDQSHPAWQRLKAEELLAQQLSQLRAKQEREHLRAPVLRRTHQGLDAQLQATLPFRLTRAQTRVVKEISADLQRSIPMHRLLQGDVGSGKTVVAALAATQSIEAGWQCVLMAPTEILAEQHFSKLVAWLMPLLEPRGLGVAWLTGSQKKKERMRMLALIHSGEAALVVGTHAVIQEHVQFQRLGLAIIDEQHRFGVAQRLALRTKSQEVGVEPHLLMMSATPIPRTLAMSYYADLDVSTIDQLPPGRSPVVTKAVSEQRREEVMARIRHQVAQGRQVYWVCPLIEESETLDLSNATATHVALSAALAGLQNADGSPVLVGLLHSRLPVAEKKAVMALFSAGLMGVLVSTTVIEVGVDVPNASLMVIEHAERFGLSQLHQLRGRVGRGSAASFCLLLYSQNENGRLSETARERLRAMVETADGFEIARRDLEIRGPGEFLGARQSGAAMLRFADLTADMPVLAWARDWAPRIWQTWPELARQHIERWFGGKSDYLKA